MIQMRYLTIFRLIPSWWCWEELKERLIKRAVNCMDTSQGDWWAQWREDASLGQGPGLNQDPPGCTSAQVLPQTNVRPRAQASQGPREMRDINLSLAAVWKLRELARNDTSSKGSSYTRSQPAWAAKSQQDWPAKSWTVFQSGAQPCGAAWGRGGLGA